MHSNSNTLTRLQERRCPQGGNAMKAHSIIQGKKIAVDDEGFQESLKNIYARKLRPLGRSESPNEAIQQLIWSTWNHNASLNDNYRLPAGYSSTSFKIKAILAVIGRMETNTGLTTELLQEMNLMRAWKQALQKLINHCSYPLKLNIW